MVHVANIEQGDTQQCLRCKALLFRRSKDRQKGYKPGSNVLELGPGIMKAGADVIDHKTVPLCAPKVASKEAGA